MKGRSTPMQRFAALDDAPAANIAGRPRPPARRAGLRPTEPPEKGEAPRSHLPADSRGASHIWERNTRVFPSPQLSERANGNWVPSAPAGW
jgi:hypothetical protein